MKPLFYIVASVAVICNLFLLSSIYAHALIFDEECQYQTESMVQIWEKKKYGGDCLSLGIGEYETLEQKVKSITVPQEYVVFAYSKENFKGKEYVFNDSVERMFKFSLTDGFFFVRNIKSIKVALIESEPIDITDIDDAQKNDIMIEYAPRIYMAKEEPYAAVSLSWTFENFDRVVDSKGNSRIVMKEKADGAHDICETFYGEQETAVAYAFWVEKNNNYVDLVYFIFCSYDSGKYIWLVNNMVGGHPGDWEHFTLRFLKYEKGGNVYMRPVKTAFAAHTFAEIATWEELEMYDDTHCEIFCASGTHGLYPHAGTYTYANFIAVQLKDVCTKGENWDLWLPGNLETFELVPQVSCRSLAGSAWAEVFGYDLDDPMKGGILYWGNEAEYPPFMNSGPQGPQFKTEMTHMDSFK